MRLPLLLVRQFDPDEFEHLHAAWCVSQGLQLYVDFFEHHTPWYYWFLSPSFALFDAAGSADEAVKVLFLARLLSWGLTGLSLGLVIWIGLRWAGMRVGVLGALLLAGQLRIQSGQTEVRPGSFLGAGICLGGAIMCTQKMLFTLPGVGIGLAIWFVVCRRSVDDRSALWALGLFAVGLVLPLALTWAFFALRGTGGAFLEMNFLVNARWQVRIPPDQFLVQLWQQSWLLCLVAAAGIVVGWMKTWRGQRWDGLGVLLTTSLAGLLAGLYLIPVAMRQYYLMFLPLVALFAARALVEFCRQLPGRCRPVWLLVALALLHISPLVHYRDSFRVRNDAQLAALRFVQTHSAANDPVLDGWRGIGVFRPHAFHYFFLHHEVRAMVPKAEWDAFLAALRAGEIRPKVIVMDPNLAEFQARMRNWLDQHYQWMPEHGLYLRRQQDAAAFQPSRQEGQ